MRKFALGLILSVCLAAAAQAQSLVFTAIPDEDETRLRQRFDKVAAYLSKELGVEVSYIPVKSYAAAVTAFRNDQVQLAWFGGLSGVRARLLVPGSEALAQGSEDRFFVTYFIAHASTGIEAGEAFPTAIEGKTFTFGSKGSTSGRLMPEYHIRAQFKRAPDGQAMKRSSYSMPPAWRCKTSRPRPWSTSAHWNRETGEGSTLRLRARGIA